MRAVLLEKDFNSADIGQEFKLEGDQARHLIKVLRIKKHEKVLLLNGSGAKAKTTILHVDRKQITLKLDSLEIIKDERRLSLFLGLPKKDSFESIVRMAAEIGLKKIYLFNSEYSQLDLEINERILKIEESGLLQSNNPFRIEFIKCSSFEEAFNQYERVINFSTFNSGELPDTSNEEILMIIGPEAGFSEKEEQEINGFSNVSVCQLPTNIMRAPTAMAVGAGYLLSKF
jgi:16S rRNA (uracil1498-N3)-methyltransferase